jgi:hypothetical protein
LRFHSAITYSLTPCHRYEFLLYILVAPWPLRCTFNTVLKLLAYWSDFSISQNLNFCIPCVYLIIWSKAGKQISNVLEACSLVFSLGDQEVEF